MVVTKLLLEGVFWQIQPYKTLLLNTCMCQGWWRLICLFLIGCPRIKQPFHSYHCGELLDKSNSYQPLRACPVFIQLVQTSEIPKTSRYYKCIIVGSTLCCNPPLFLVFIPYQLDLLLIDVYKIFRNQLASIDQAVWINFTNCSHVIYHFAPLGLATQEMSIISPIWYWL